jgi:four helix bundle protein
LILKLTFEFAADIILYTELLESKKKFSMAKQLFRSGTAIGALAREAQNSESRADFIHKFKIAAKEMDETEYWLELCVLVYKHKDAETLLQKLESISKVINKIISTAKGR